MAPDSADTESLWLPTVRSVGSSSTNTASTYLPAPVSEKKVMKASTPPPMVLSESLSQGRRHVAHPSSQALVHTAAAAAASRKRVTGKVFSH